MSNEQKLHPIEDSHAVSVDEALMLMLGIRGQLKHYVDGEEIDVFLEDILLDIQEKADIALDDAKADREDYEASDDKDESKLKDLFKAVRDCQAKLDDANALVERYNQYSDRLKHEVLKLQSGQESILLLDPDLTQRMGCPQVTKISLYEWCRSNLGLDLLSPSRRVTNLAPVNQPDKLTKNNSITTYLLAQALAEVVDAAREKDVLPELKDEKGKPIRLVKGEGLNISAVVNFLKPYRKGLRGQGDRIVHDRITDAKESTSPADLENIQDEEIEEVLGIGETHLND